MPINIDLRRTVLDELEWEPSIDATDIGVTVRDGVVTLTGFAPSYAEKLKAEQVAKRVRGVRAIANDIEVRLSGKSERTDTDIARAAADALKWRTSVPGDEIKVSVSKGRITLEGNVHWQFQKSGAYESVHHLVGVRGITNLITVTPKVLAGEVKSRIEAAFRRSAEVDSRKCKWRPTTAGLLYEAMSAHGRSDRRLNARPGQRLESQKSTISSWSRYSASKGERPLDRRGEFPCNPFERFCSRLTSRRTRKKPSAQRAPWPWKTRPGSSCCMLPSPTSSPRSRFTTGSRSSSSSRRNSTKLSTKHSGRKCADLRS